MLIVVGKKLRLPLLLLLLFTTRITATLKVSAKGFNYKSVVDKIANGCAENPFPFNSEGFGYVGQSVSQFQNCTHTVSFEKAAIYSYSHLDATTVKIHQCFPISGTTKFGIAVYSVVSNPYRARICAEGETEESAEEGNPCKDKSKNEIGKYVRIVWLKNDEAAGTYSWCVIDFNDSVFDSLEGLLDVEVTLEYLENEKNTILKLTDPSASTCGGFSFSTLKILDDNDPLAQAGAVDQLCYIIYTSPPFV